MHFSALTVLACVLVASAAPAWHDNHDNSDVSVAAPADVSNVGNYNVVDILNKVGDKRGLLDIAAPICISDILNCNTIEVANNILNGLALDLGCLVADLLITVGDIIGCHDASSARDLLSKAANHGSHNSKHYDDHGDGGLIDIWAPITFENIGNGNHVDILNDVANGKRGLVNIFAPINISNILNCNNIEVANHILDGLAAELGCLVAELLITVEDILSCHDEASAHDLLSRAADNASHNNDGDKRGLIDIFAPINISNILNCNNIAIANDILNGLALDLGCLVGDLLITVEDILSCHDESSAHDLLSRAADNASHNSKRGLVNIFAPINISNILNCNNVEIANNILNGLAAELGCLVSELLITVQDILGCHDEASARNILSRIPENVGGKRDLISAYAPITISDILNCNTIAIANDILNDFASWLGCTVAELLITVEDIIGCHDVSSARGLLNKIPNKVNHSWKGHGDNGIVDIYAPITIKNSLNGNQIGILNNVL